MKKIIPYILCLLVGFKGLGQTLPTPQNPNASIDYYNTVSLNFSFDATGLFPVANTGQTLYFEIEIDNGTTKKTFRTSNYTFATPNNAYSFSKTLAHGFSYTFKVKAFFKESTLGATTTSNQSSQSNVITATNPRGVTVLTHGFAGTGSLDASWKANARALRNRLSSETGSGKGATILINNTSTGVWEFMEGENGALDLNEEIIFLFDWAAISRTPLLGNQTGYLESAADVLYSILINPNVRMSNGQLTQLGGSSPGQLLLDKNSHFIGHSRGTIVMLQLLHRLKSNFSAINIERLTLLDPHPAGTFGDVKRADVNGSPENLPGVHGAATTCGIFLCYDGGQSVYLTVPDNVLKVEDFYRQGWAYEPPAEVNGGISPFMGIPLIGGNNSYLMNNNIMNAGAGDAGFLGGAHSAVPTWYFQTVDLSLPLSSTQSDWFSTLVGPFMTGKTRATAGYNITNLPNIPIKATLSDYNSALNIRTGQATLAKVFNGNFGYGNDSGWRLNNLNSTEPNIDNVNKWLVLLPMISNVATHNIMNFSTNYTSISMDVKLDVGTYMGTVIPKLIIEYYSANGQKIKQAIKTLSLIPPVQFSRIHFGLPNELQGKNGTFRLRFADNGALNDYNTSNLKILVDNIELSNETTTVSPPVISANKTIIPSGQSANLSATGCTNGIIYWTTGEVGPSIIVNPIETTGYAAFCEQDGYFSIPSNAIGITVTYASTLANAEYFIDTDPGIGLATALSGIPSSGVINQTIPINLAPLSLPQGVHSIGIRVKDQNDKWSLTHTKTFLILGSATTGTNAIADVEYFVDSLKQDKSNLVSTGITAANDATISLAIPQNIPQGVHSVSFRVKDNNGKHSLFHTKTYLVLGIGSGATNALSEVQYFYDQDPGEANRTTQALSLDANNTAQIPLNITLSLGVHSVSFRVKDTHGKWSLFHTKVFLVLGTGVGNTLSKIEYFFDTDPGFGNGTQVNYTVAVGDTQVLEIPTTDLITGVHVLNVRVKNTANQWSLTHAKVFLIMPNMGGNTTISRVEYFIGDTDPGQGSGTSVAFSPNPDGSNVVSSFDINLANHQAGLVRISARVKDSENRWSPLVSRTVQFLPNIAIVKLPESSIYESNYNVLQQSIVHRYYQVRKASDDQPMAGVVLKYKLSNRPNDIFESSVSDVKGLVDLKIPIGGSNQLITNDDIIPAGVSNVGVSFDAAAFSNKPLNVSTNMFNANDFSISTYATQQPEEKEYGVATGIGATIGLTKGVKFQLGPIEGEAGLASVSLGAAYGGIVTIKPDLSNQDIWEVAINGTSDYESEISLGPKIELEAASAISVDGGINLNASILGGKRNEHIYNINLNQVRELYYTAYKILLMKSNLSDDRLLRAANFFKRMSENNNQSPLSLISKGKMSSIGLNASFNSNIGISSSIAKNTNIAAGIEFGAEVSGELALENKNSIDIATNEDINEGSVSMGVSASAGYSASLDYDLGQDREATFSAPTPLYFSSSESTTLGVERRTLNNQLKGFSTSFESNKSLSIAGITYEVDYTNEIELNTNLSQAVSNYYKTNSNVNNLFGSFLSHGKFGFVSMQNGFSSNNNFYNQFVNFSKKVGELTTSSQGNKPFIHRLSRTYTNKFGGEFEFSVALGIELGLNLNLEAWSSHTSTLAEYTYLPSVQRIAKTIDRPLNDSFITLPTQNPFEIFFDRVKARLLQEALPTIQAAYDGFVQKVFEPVSTSVTKFYSNLGSNRLSLSGEKLNKPTDTKALSNSNSPSVLTFSVPPAPATFNIGTEVRFSYYYPENKLKTPIGVDTFQIVSDVFYLNAIDGQNRLSIVPNGNFTVSTNFSTYDLNRASLPSGSLVKLVFKQEGTNNWIVLGDVNTTISYDKLGVFAIAAKLQTDRISPEVTITDPTNGQNYFTVTLAENQSGINWANTTFSVNGQVINFVRTGTTNTFTVPLNSIPTPTDGVFRIIVSTSDLAYNTAVKNWKYPCESDLSIHSVTSSVPVVQKVSGIINVNAFVPENSNLSFQAGKFIIFEPGFEMKDGKTMQAEVKGCDN